MKSRLLVALKKAGIVALGLTALSVATSCSTPLSAKVKSGTTATANHTDALVAQYRFDSAAAGGTISPVAGTSSATMAIGSSNTFTIAGKVSTLALTSPSGSSTTQGASIDGALLAADDSALTIALWMKDVTSDWENIINVGVTAIDCGNIVSTASASGASTIWTANTTFNPQDAVLAAATAYNWAFSSGWTHLVIVIDPTKGIVWYKNGVLQVTHPISNANTAVLVPAIVAEAQSSGTKHIWLTHNGGADPASTIDDVRFYNYALSASQVATLYATFP